MEIKKKFILTIVLLSYLATAINGAIVITGLENMAKDFGFKPICIVMGAEFICIGLGMFHVIGRAIE